MSDTNLASLPEPVRFEAAKSELTAFMGDLQRGLGLSDTLAVAVMECVMGNQRANLSSMLAQQVAGYDNTLREVRGELEAMKKAEDETKGERNAG